MTSSSPVRILKLLASQNSCTIWQCRRVRIFWNNREYRIEMDEHTLWKFVHASVSWYPPNAYSNNIFTVELILLSGGIDLLVNKWNISIWLITRSLISWVERLSWNISKTNSNYFLWNFPLNFLLVNLTIN